MEVCLCGSRKPPNQCCIPTNPPIHMEIPPFIRSSKLHRVGYPKIVNQVQIRYGVEKGPAILAQVDPLIADALGFDLKKIHLDNATERNTIIFPLHAIRYHLKQFMHRLRYIQREITKLARRTASDPLIELIQCEDVPLRCEFEAFISRMAAYLDAMGRYIAKMLKISVKNHGSHNRIQNYLRNGTGGKREEHQAILQAYETHAKWSKKLLNIRNEIMHEGMSMDMTIPENYFESRIFDPTLDGESVEELVLTFWSKVLELTRSLILLTS
ncbi:hypothetical protein SAMN04487969_1423 [Paenibacillus algorifonticola]|uniref:Uncharacterized protein n=1 Tax=Paenibacillus algorifonticola TaxID=684063 RepID=A0A1I2ITR2_9BACL|nr:hypothetical protein [Paenibacillus algorifonticola]SFF45684.1 hypothetical protein SAMN04487969_1423 [Paenibacillus algorifonticola]